MIFLIIFLILIFRALGLDNCKDEENEGEKSTAPLSGLIDGKNTGGDIGGERTEQVEKKFSDKYVNSTPYKKRKLNDILDISPSLK